MGGWTPSAMLLTMRGARDARDSALPVSVTFVVQDNPKVWPNVPVPSLIVSTSTTSLRRLPPSSSPSIPSRIVPLPIGATTWTPDM